MQQPRQEDATRERDVLVLAKTVATNDFPVERAGLVGIDRESGRIVRVSPMPWKGADTDPPVLRWAWIHFATAPSRYDPRPETIEPEGEIVQTAYVDPKDGWRLRWPFVRPHLLGSLEAFSALAKEGAASAGFVTPIEMDVVQLPLRLRFRCASDECSAVHELPVLDWELHEMARAARERYGAQWATKFRETWGAALLTRYDVRLLVSSYAQAPSRAYVAGLFYPPREAEDAHAHLHHAEHRSHARGG